MNIWKTSGSYEEFRDNTDYLLFILFIKNCKKSWFYKKHDDAVYLFLSSSDWTYILRRVSTENIVEWSHDWIKTFPAKTALNVLNQNLYIYFVGLATNSR